MTENIETKTQKTFKERYNNDPEYKRRHLEYINEKLPCECGRMISRVYIAKHVTLEKHKRDLDRVVKGNNNNNKIENLDELVKKLVEEQLKNIKFTI